MYIHDLPTHRRPRERLIEQGPHALTVAELLAILIGSGSAGATVFDLAERLEIVVRTEKDITPATLQSVRGIGQSKAALLCAAIELGARLQQRDLRTIFYSPGEVYKACADLLSLPQENLVVFYLNVRNQSVQRETISVGTVSQSLIHPREVFRTAILHAASGVILAHNHPSGVAEASEADRQATRLVAKAGKEIGIPLLDHIICTERGFLSLKEESPVLFT